MVSKKLKGKNEMLNKILKRETKLNSIKFGIAGGLTTSVFIFLVEIFFWIKIIPLYNSFMVNLYGVASYTTIAILNIFSLYIFLGFILGFILTWLFAWSYNKLLLIKMK